MTAFCPARPGRAPAITIQSPLDTSNDPVERALRFVAAMRDPSAEGHYRISQSNPSDLYACSYVPQILALLGRLDRMPEHEQCALSERLQSYQTREGYFEEHVSPTWSTNAREVNRLLMTALAVSALSLLGRSPLRGLSFLEPVRTAAGMRSWFDDRRRAALKGGDPWFESIATECLASCLLNDTGNDGGDPFEFEALQAYFDCLEELQDRYLGFWGTQTSLRERLRLAFAPTDDRGMWKRLVIGMGTTFHMVDIYAALDRPVPKARLIAENTMRCQHHDGLFNPRGGGSQCHDLDGISILANLYHQVPRSTQARIRETMKRTQDAFNTLTLENPDGGYRNFADGSPYQKGDAPLHIRQGESDLLSTWFRLATLAYIERTLEPGTSADKRWRFPSCGFLHYCPARCGGGRCIR